MAIGVSRVVLILLTMALCAGGCSRGAKRASLEPFDAVRPLERGQVYLRIDATATQEPAAWLSVNGGPWATEAVASRGDLVEISGGPDAGPCAVSYEVYGSSARGYLHFAERRWFYDGYPADRCSVRVAPYGDMIGPAEPAAPGRNVAAP